jgi:hypothetical protein
MKRCKYFDMRISFSLLCILGICLTDCSSKKNDEKPMSEESSALPYEVSEDKSSLANYYQLEHIKEWYPQRILPPVFDYSMDISKKSAVELWLLRNEIFARNGHLFEDAVLRGYFNQFKWYQPIFDVPEFKAQLSKQEQEFVNKIIARENELKGDRYINSGSYSMINMDHVYNQMQFKEIPQELNKLLSKNNFAIVPAQHEQLFHVYDENHYQYVPNFITTDIYLQVLHKHFSSLLQKIEEDKFTPLLTELLKNALEESLQFETKTNDDQLKKAAQWSTTYLAIGYTLISGNPQLVSDELQQFYTEETEKIMSASGTGSEFIKSTVLQYSQFKPRGNYTKTPELENYFRCVKWLNTAPIYIKDDERFLSAILLATYIKNSAKQLQSFQTFNEAMKFIVGHEDNLSLAHLINFITPEEAKDPSLLNDVSKLKALREKLAALDVDKIKPQGGDKPTSEELSQASILFTAGRYTFDAEILSKLIHVLQPKPRRPFPKGLDVFATFGNKEAESILINEYREDKQWDGYTSSLSKLKGQFGAYNDWDRNIYTKTFEAINSLHTANTKYPLFMKTPSWERKNLSTSLASWTELKHDMLLYAEQPYAAQAGEGGGPPPPQHLSYVEPNVTFWKKALELVDLQERTLTKMDLLGEDVNGINEELREIGNLLLTVSEKELANEEITAKEFDALTWLGGSIEYLTFRIFNSDHLPEKERLVSLVADVYQYNGEYLEEAVGLVDEIYVVTEINGKPYLTKGAVFSYYEFNSGQPLSDEEWQKQLLSGKVPKRPTWLMNIMVEAKSLESKPEYSF